MIDIYLSATLKEVCFALVDSANPPAIEKASALRRGCKGTSTLERRSVPNLGVTQVTIAVKTWQQLLTQVSSTSESLQGSLASNSSC